MATDYAEMEREFLASLEADTGHDLAGWMALIDKQNLSHRNDIIDWLRTQRFQFSWASWLERIHHNGGRPIYNAPPATASAPPRVDALTKPQAPPIETSSAAPRAPLAAIPPLAPAPPRALPLPLQALGGEPSGSLNDLLAKAKAYRMLAEHLLREVRRAIPDVNVAARGTYVSLSRTAEFGVLSLSPKEIRLGLELGDLTIPEVPRGRIMGTAANVTHVLVLTDARQVTPALIDAVRQSDRRVNGG